MVILSAKLSKSKLITIVLILIIAVLVLSFCLRSADDSKDPSAEQTPAQTVSYEAKTNEDRIAFLNTFGWEVSEEPVQSQQVRVPTDPSDVFVRYNDLQISQGFDLMEYSGKTLNRYVYQITNYPAEDGNYYATMLIYKNEIVGGDVSSGEKNGVMHGFSQPK